MSPHRHGYGYNFMNTVLLLISVKFFRRLQHLSVSTGVIMHISPSQPMSSPHSAGAIIGILNTECPITGSKDKKRVVAGKVSMLRL